MLKVLDIIFGGDNLYYSGMWEFRLFYSLQKSYIAFVMNCQNLIFMQSLVLSVR